MLGFGHTIGSQLSLRLLSSVARLYECVLSEPDFFFDIFFDKYKCKYPIIVSRLSSFFFNSCTLIPDPWFSLILAYTRVRGRQEAAL